MVRPHVPFRTFESLIIFWMGYINMYLAHAVAPRRLIHCIYKLPVTGQFLMPLPSGKFPSPITPDNIGILRYIGAQPNDLSFVHSMYESSSDCWGHIWISRTHTCMISLPASAYSLSSLYRPTGHPEYRSGNDTDRGRLESNHRNYIPPQWHNIPSHITTGCLPLRRPVQKKENNETDTYVHIHKSQGLCQGRNRSLVSQAR